MRTSINIHLGRASVYLFSQQYSYVPGTPAQLTHTFLYSQHPQVRTTRLSPPLPLRHMIHTPMKLFHFLKICGDNMTSTLLVFLTISHHFLSSILPASYRTTKQKSTRTSVSLHHQSDPHSFVKNIASLFPAHQLTFLGLVCSISHTHTSLSRPIRIRNRHGN